MAITDTSRHSIERGPLFTQTHATSSPRGGLNTHTVTEYDIITDEDITKLANLVWTL